MDVVPPAQTHDLNEVTYGAPRANLWSPKTIPTYTPGHWSASVRKCQGFGGSSADERNPPKHDTLIIALLSRALTHSSTAKAVVSCVGGWKTDKP